jgi:hypothetical protein
MLVSTALLRTASVALNRLRKAGSVLVYRSAKQHSEPVSKPHNKQYAKVDEITLTPLELIERIAALVPTGADQAPGALPMGGVDRPNLRSVPFVVPPVWRADAHHRLHHAQRRLCQRCGAGLRLSPPKTGHSEKSRATGPV